MKNGIETTISAIPALVILLTSAALPAGAIDGPERVGVTTTVVSTTGTDDVGAGDVAVRFPVVGGLWVGVTGGVAGGSDRVVVSGRAEVVVGTGAGVVDGITGAGGEDCAVGIVVISVCTGGGDEAGG